jgi:hypothetical protein
MNQTHKQIADIVSSMSSDRYAVALVHESYNATNLHGMLLPPSETLPEFVLVAKEGTDSPESLQGKIDSFEDRTGMWGALRLVSTYASGKEYVSQFLSEGYHRFDKS